METASRAVQISWTVNTPFHLHSECTVKVSVQWRFKCRPVLCKKEKNTEKIFESGPNRKQLFHIATKPLGPIPNILKKIHQEQNFCREIIKY